MTSAAKFLGEQRPELQHPSSDRFIGDVQPALGQQIFDIAEAEGKAKIQPHGVPDDVRRDNLVDDYGLACCRDFNGWTALALHAWALSTFTDG